MNVLKKSRKYLSLSYDHHPLEQLSLVWSDVSEVWIVDSGSRLSSSQCSVLVGWYRSIDFLQDSILLATIPTGLGAILIVLALLLVVLVLMLTVLLPDQQSGNPEDCL